MPIATTTCAICNQTVNKVQTLFIGDKQRACRIHEGVEEKAKAIHAVQVAKVIEKDAKFRKKVESPVQNITVLPAVVEWATHTCWCCGVKTAVKRLPLPLHTSENLLEKHRRNLIIKEVGRDDKERGKVCDFVGFVQVCQKCQEIHKLEKEKSNLLIAADVLSRLGLRSTKFAKK